MVFEARKQPDEGGVEDVRPPGFRPSPIELGMEHVERGNAVRQAAAAVGQRQVRARTGERVRRLELRGSAEAADELRLKRVIGRLARMIPERDVVVAKDAKLPEEVV